MLSALEIEEVAEPYIRRRAIHHLKKKRVVIFAGGTGDPFFTAPTRPPRPGPSIGAETILMAETASGGLPSTPTSSAEAKLITEISHRGGHERGLKVMDTTALSLCMENDMPIRVFNVNDERNIVQERQSERSCARARPSPPARRMSRRSV